MTHTNILYNVQCLRALAAYMVVAYHARQLTPIGEAISFEFGNAGVDIFFLISGFIINHVAARADAGAPATFLLKRLIRIVPLYWLLTLFVGAMGHLVPALMGVGGYPYASRIVRSLLFIPYYDDSGEAHPVLFMGWTLNYEMFFYLLFAAGLLLIRRELPRLWALSAVMAGLVAAGMLFEPRGAIASTYTGSLLLEFTAGMWMSRAWRGRHGATEPASPWQHVPPILAILVALGLLVIGDHAWPDAPRLLRWGAPSALIVMAALTLEHRGATLRWRWLLLIGEASYAIYLIHPFIIKAVSIALAAVALPVPDRVILAGTFAATGVLGAGLHLWVERPLLRALRRRVLPRATAKAERGN